MSVSHLLEDFSTASPSGHALTNEVMIEEEKLAAFEKGYQAGWDDCLRAQQDSRTRISEDFARNIRDLSFTYEEAYSAFVADMQQLMRQVVDAVLPALARETIGVRVVEILRSEIAARERPAVRLMTAPGQSAALSEILPEDTALPVTVEEDASLAEGQIHLRFGSGAERELNLDKVLADISTAVDGFFHEATQQVKESA